MKSALPVLRTVIITISVTVHVDRRDWAGPTVLGGVLWWGMGYYGTSVHMGYHVAP